jgi:hypothetical protein
MGDKSVRPCEIMLTSHDCRNGGTKQSGKSRRSSFGVRLIALPAFERHLPGAHHAPPADDCSAWSACGNGSPGTVTAFRRRISSRPWAAAGERSICGTPISDAHTGLVAAIGAVLPGSSWQLCRTHYARNLLCQVPKSAQPWVATLLRTVFEQPDKSAVQAQMRHVLDALEAKFPKAAAHLDAAQHDLLAFTAFPREIWRQIWPTTRRNGSTKRSAAAPTWSASSPTAPP